MLLDVGQEDAEGFAFGLALAVEGDLCAVAEGRRADLLDPRLVDCEAVVG